MQESDPLACEGCGHVHTARPTEGFGRTLVEQHKTTRRFAEIADTDMATAYAVVLGIMPPEVFRNLRAALAEIAAAQAASAGKGAESPEPADPPEPTGAIEHAAGADEAAEAFDPTVADPGRSEWYLEIDPAFQPAVDKGFLTIRAAAQRGNREQFVTSLADRHGLPRKLAYLVADNRVSLHEALQAKPVEPEPYVPPPPVPRSRVALILLATIVPLAGLTWYYWDAHFESRPTAPQARVPRTPESVNETRGDVGPSSATSASLVPAIDPVPFTEMLRDDSGRVIEIRGPDPGSVLRSYCSEEPGRFVPIEITEAVPKLGTARLGVFRDRAGLGPPLSIWMRRDWRTRRWVAGDGKGPIPVNEAPALPPGAFRRAIAPEARGTGP